MKKILALIIALIMVLSFSACGGEEPSREPGKIPTDKFTGGESENPSSEFDEEDDTIENEELPADIADDSYETIIGEIEWTGSCCAVAYIGFVDGPMGDGYRGIVEENGYMEFYPFIADIPSERFVATAGYELYCIVPASLDCTVKVVEAYLHDDPDVYGLVEGDTIYYSETGEPILLLCNESEIYTNVVVKITMPDGTEKLITPYLSGMDGSLCGISDDGLDALDFSAFNNGEGDYNYTEDFLGFGDLLGDWTATVYPDGMNAYTVGLEFFYNEYDQRCANFWYGPEYSDMDEYYTGTVYEDYDEYGNWTGGYILDMYLAGGLFYDGEDAGITCSYKFQEGFDGTGSIYAIHYGIYDPLPLGYENDYFEFFKPMG